MKKKIEGVLNAAADLPPENIKIDDYPVIDKAFIDDELPDNADLETEKKTFLAKLNTRN